uniref:PROLYL-4 HYDROXYLASE n=1 Tax=Chlamydomonas reinhardtii TaxID=3055 RepID=UPI0001753AD6|nr:Chain A, PROLYL-4 HYDROXYLASE [Chlamydomonas reinhardtii]2JIJ_B Chain B, PROLYL-4 HYDROXYLASE [Chlamydomonas reinhardtii]2JIJ_C Chain C, PROLYL-4 HYDROXYLASE [Chlamydomonas reinhardtii]
MHHHHHHMVGFGELKEEWRGEVVHLSWSPRAFLLKNFLSDEECDYIVEKARPKMVKSSVVDNESGKSVDSEIRTSTGTWFAKGEDSVISKIEKRVAQVTMIPLENHEGLQVLHYHDGQKYEPHYDYFHDPVNAGPEHGGQRVVTMLMYLTTVEEGGETVLPNAEQKVTGDGWSECAKRGLAVKPIKGDALMFYSLKPDGSNDPASLHGSCPTLKGDKWSATKWIHVAPIGGRH